LRAEQHHGLADVAASVADGTPVDWNAIHLQGSQADQRLVRHLRLVESIASLHRSIPTTPGDDEDEDDPVPAGRAMPASGPHWGRLTLLERIGQGTSCEVYRAWDTTLHREVALKLLHQDGANADAHTRLLEEARRLARLRHEHVVQVYGAEQHDGRVGLWMELVRGQSLEQVVKTRGVFGPREAALIGLDLCSALAAVHAAGLLHRDVKAQNVMREERGRIVLMDFGTGEELAGTNRLVGTPLYLAPEIFRGQRASVQSDLYSLGVLLFYLVTGKFPVVAGSMEQLARAHAHRQRQPLRDLRPDVPEAFIRTSERALDSAPTRRVQSGGALEAGLRESLDEPQTGAHTGARVAARRTLGSRFLIAAGTLAAMIAALIVWTGWPPSVTSGSVDSLAVLPIVDKTAASPSEFSEALTEQLIATIGMVDSLRTTSLTATLPFKGSGKAPAEIARLLGVDAVLDGVLTVVNDVTGGPGKLRLEGKVVSAKTGEVIWSGAATRRRGDAAALLADVARAVARAMNAPVTSNEAVRLRQTQRTNPAAEEAYLQGRFQLSTYGADATERALDAFNRAIVADPQYSAAYASKAVAYLRLASYNRIAHGEARQEATAAIAKAYENGNDNAEAHAAAADLKFLYDWDWNGAEQEYRRSLDLNPGYLPARNNFAQVLAARKRWDETLQVSEESLRMDPQSVEALVNHGMLLYYKHDWDGARRVAEQALTMQPGSGFALRLRSRVAEAEGRYEDALVDAREAKRLAGDAWVNLEVVIIRLQFLAGRTADARRALAVLEQARLDGRLHVRPRDLAYIYTAQGRNADALDQFERALEDRDPSLVWLTLEPRVDPLRNDPRFQAILRRIGLD
jgi:tetratricopeptide (TPR) repeat protein